MTDRINGLFVTFSQDLRDDEIEEISNAIRMIKGVLSVTANIVDPSDHIAYQRMRTKMIEKLYQLIESLK